MADKLFIPEQLAILSPSLGYVVSDDFPENIKEIVQLAASAKYTECITSCCTQIPFLQLQSPDYIDALPRRIKEYLDCQDENEEIYRLLQLLCFAVSCLQFFVSINWTNSFTKDPMSLLPNLKWLDVKEKIFSSLEIDGEEVYHLVEVPIFLYTSFTVLKCISPDDKCKTSKWWFVRCISIYQQLLGERSPTLHAHAISMLENLFQDFLQPDDSRSHLIQLHLEAGLLQLFYYDYTKAKEHFEAAAKVTGLKFSFGGAMGVRTKFQTKPVAQLQMNIERSASSVMQTKCPDISEQDIPKALPLNDDLLLENVKFTEERETQTVNLTAEEQAIVLTMCTHMQKTSPSQKLRDEELLCVLEFIVSNPKSWAVHMEALRSRAMLQRFKSRTVERSMAQLENLVNDVRRKTSDDAQATIQRLCLIYSVWPKPKWMLERELAKLFESLGVLSSALDIYKRLQIWEEAIKCLICTSRGYEAEVLIKEQLSKKETPNLYCLLGDVLQDPVQYEKAWVLSKERNARAMRCLGAYRVSKKQHQEAIDCFEKSLKINHLQVGVWFSMGCAALACEEYEKAAKTFQRCVSLKWDNFEAWGNLATSFIRCNKKVQAFRALQEALKCEFGIWQLWENFLFVCVDVGQFSEAIRAYNRLLDLKDKYLEISVLSLLVRVVTEDILDAYEQPASRHKSKLKELFGRLTSKTTSNWEVWALYAILHGGGSSGRAEDDEKGFLYLQRALRSALQTPAWEKDEKTAKKITNIALDLIKALLSREKQGNIPKDRMKSTLTSTRMEASRIVAKLKMQAQNVIARESRQQITELEQLLDEQIRSLNECISSIAS